MEKLLFVFLILLHSSYDPDSIFHLFPVIYHISFLFISPFHLFHPLPRPSFFCSIILLLPIKSLSFFLFQPFTFSIFHSSQTRSMVLVPHTLHNLF